MSADPIDTLLARLNDGDAAAAEQAFVANERYLRMVVRRRLSSTMRAKFDSMDIVQSVWAELLAGLRQGKWTFRDADQLRAFLITMTQHRFIDRLRKHRSAVHREVAMEPDEIADLPAARAGRVSEAFHADELWHQMLAACPPEHYELLHLKRQGASVAEIAAHTGLHAGSVRRILYQIARDVARLRAAGSSSR